jgi:hypothetical protein
MKMCAFCPTQAAKLSREHIWDNWINRELPTKRFRVRQRWSRDQPFREYDATVLQEKLEVVCENCNHTWMSDLTNRVRQAYSAQIINGSALTLMTDDAALLGAYAFMKSVVADHATPKDERFFSLEVREQFRRTLAIPPNVRMWIAAYQGEHRFGGRFHNAILTPNEPSVLDGIEYYAFTYVVGHLVLQTHAVRWRDGRSAFAPVPKPDPYWDPAVIQFWPYSEPVSWPPKKYIGDDTLEALMNRFSLPISVPAF